MRKPVEIPHPDLKSATVLKPMELNALHFDPKHTVLTPEYLKGLSAESSPSQPK